MRINKTFIPDRSGPGSTMTVTSNWAPRVTDGHATGSILVKREEVGNVGGRRKRGRREERKDMKIELKVGSLNVGTMTGKSREIVYLMERRNVDVLCVQETRWKGAKGKVHGRRI